MRRQEELEELFEENPMITQMMDDLMPAVLQAEAVSRILEEINRLREPLSESTDHTRESY